MRNIRRMRAIIAIVIIIAIVASGAVGFWFGQNGEMENERTEKELIVRFLNIGHGLSILITTPDDKNILIDAGSFDNFISTVDFIEDLNITRIDAFIITHPHPDHVSFAAEVFERVEVLEVYMPGNEDDLEPELWSSVMNAAIAEGCPIYDDKTLEPGDYLQLSEDVSFRLMWIDANATLINDSCIVLRMDYKSTSFLFTADIENAAESAMIALGMDLDVDILQVAHHGVDSGTSGEFLNLSTPEVGIISCGLGYGTPHVPQPRVIERLNGIPIYVTMYNSVVVVSVKDDTYNVFYV